MDFDWEMEVEKPKGFSTENITTTSGPHLIQPTMVEFKGHLRDITNSAKYSRASHGSDDYHVGHRFERVLHDLHNDSEDSKLGIHIANKISGGTTEMRNDSDAAFQKNGFLSALDPIDLSKSESQSYLDYATYVLYRKKQEEDQGNSTEGAEFGNKMNKELKELKKLMDEKENNPDQSENDENGDDKGGNGPGKGGESLIGDMIEAYEENLDNATKTVSLIMETFVPEPTPDMSSMRKVKGGRFRRQERMNDLGQLPKMNHVDLAESDEHFIRKLANKDYYVKEQFDTVTKKQFVYVSLDISGSMDDLLSNNKRLAGRTRFSVAKKIAYYLAERVESGKAEMFFRTLGDDPGPLKTAKTPEEAKKLKEYIKKLDDNDGTDISLSLRQIYKDIQEFMQSHPDFAPPEIVLITDGGDVISKRDAPPAGIRLNYISVCDHENEDLADISDKVIKL